MADHTYRYLSALVSQGSFSQAARYLDISQPPFKAYGRRGLFSADRAAH